MLGIDAGDDGEEQVPLRSMATDRIANEDHHRIRANSGDVLSGPHVIEVTPPLPPPVRPAISCTSLNEGQSNAKPRPPFLRTATRLSIRRGRSNSRAYKYSLAVHEPEIQAVNNAGQDAIEAGDHRDDIQDHNIGELEQVTQLGDQKPESFFTRYKLERGSLSAFKREARNIIERDLPLILHRDNIIKVFTDKVGSLTGYLVYWYSNSFSIL